MADTYELDTGTAFYRTKDPIKNLKVRVHLERVTSATLVPQAQLEKETGGGLELQKIQEQQFAGRKDDEYYTFQWQEKVFSQAEINKYEDYDSCTTPLAREYHLATKPLRDGVKTKSTKRLFTYVNNDNYTESSSNIGSMTTDPNEKPSHLAEAMSTVRQRKAGPSNFRREIPSTCQVAYEPSEEMRKRNHLPSSAVQSMYIMAEISEPKKVEGSEEPTPVITEYLLCTIKFDSTGIISACPDFSKGQKPYRIESSGIGRDIFEYTVEHVSDQMSRLEAEKESKMLKQLYGRHSEYLATLVGGDFEPMPPADSLRVLVYGEIESAKDFEYDHLYIQYYVDLPEFWVPVSGQLSGITQICSTKSIRMENVAHFSFPFNYELVYRNDSLDPQSREQLPRWPTLLFEVLSIDSWERYRIEGYGYASLPHLPGPHMLDVNCWRPAGDSFTSDLRRFFIGGSPELEDLTYSAIPSTFEDTRMSKFGFKTVSTGSLQIRLNTIQQSRAFLQTTSTRKKMGTLMDRLGASSAQASIMGVVDAFQKAKRRMVAARENLKKDFIETLKNYQAVEDSD